MVSAKKNKTSKKRKNKAPENKVKDHFEDLTQTADRIS